MKVTVKKWSYTQHLQAAESGGYYPKIEHAGGKGGWARAGGVIPTRFYL